MEFRQDSDNYQYRKSPTSTVSTSKIFSSMNFIALGIKFVPVELLCSKIDYVVATSTNFALNDFFKIPKISKIVLSEDPL